MIQKIFVARFLIVFFLVSWTGIVKAESFKVLTWNIQDLGRTKDDAEVALIAKVMKDFDIIAIQEVVAKDPAGAQAVARIADQLNRMGSKWDYRISDPTRSPSSKMSERYAFIWKTSKIQNVGRFSLDKELQNICVREPYIGKFKLKKGSPPFYIVNFHSRKHDAQPEKEILHFAKYQDQYETELILIAGDFNLDEQHEVWNGFYSKGYQPSLSNSPTTLKRKCKYGNYLNHPIDNIFYDRDAMTIISSGKVDFIQKCANLEAARKISDHLPVYLECQIK